MQCRHHLCQRNISKINNKIVDTHSQFWISRWSWRADTVSVGWSQFHMRRRFKQQEIVPRRLSRQLAVVRLVVLKLLKSAAAQGRRRRRQCQQRWQTWGFWTWGFRGTDCSDRIHLQQIWCRWRAKSTFHLTRRPARWYVDTFFHRSSVSCCCANIHIVHKTI